jgi:hypothetical protein
LVNLEEELNQKLVIQKMMDENLKQKEQELEKRENDLMQRELIIAMLQQGHHPGPRPTPKKRKGKFRQKALNKKEGGNIISMPSGI